MNTPEQLNTNRGYFKHPTFTLMGKKGEFEAEWNRRCCATDVMLLRKPGTRDNFLEFHWQPTYCGVPGNVKIKYAKGNEVLALGKIHEGL